MSLDTTGREWFPDTRSLHSCCGRPHQLSARPLRSRIRTWHPLVVLWKRRSEHDESLLRGQSREPLSDLARQSVRDGSLSAAYCHWPSSTDATAAATVYPS